MDPKKSLKNTSRGEEEESKGKEWGGLREPIVASERRTVNKKKYEIAATPMRWRLRCTEEEKWRGDKKERPSTLRGNQGRKKRLQSRPCQWARQRNTLTIRTPERGKHERRVKRESTKADEAHKIE